MGFHGAGEGDGKKWRQMYLKNNNIDDRNYHTQCLKLTQIHYLTVSSDKVSEQELPRLSGQGLNQVKITAGTVISSQGPSILF